MYREKENWEQLRECVPPKDRTRSIKMFPITRTYFFEKIITNNLRKKCQVPSTLLESQLGSRSVTMTTTASQRTRAAEGPTKWYSQQ